RLMCCVNTTGGAARRFTITKRRDLTIMLNFRSTQPVLWKNIRTCGKWNGEYSDCRLRGVSKTVMNGNVEHLSPEGLHNNPSYSQVVVTSGNVTTIYVGGQDAVD